MNVTSIEWVKNPDGSQGYTWNPITGCLNHDNGLCKGGGFPCYAYKLANTRLEKRYCANRNVADVFTLSEGLMDRKYNDPFYPRFWREKLEIFNPFEHMIRHQASKGIFVCDMGDLFGQGVPESWTGEILSAIHRMKQHRFYLLTKQPQRLAEFSPFPENCWVGMTITNKSDLIRGHHYLYEVKAKVKFLSIEPLLGRCQIAASIVALYNWLIIGACTGSSWEMVHLGEKYNRDLTEPSAMTRLDTKWALQPRIEWVHEIVEAADKAGVKVFLKDNLESLLPLDSLFYTQVETNGGPEYRLRQELPEV